MVSDPAAPWAEAVFLRADDLAALPDDGWHYELVRGRLVRMSPAGLRHGRIAMRLAIALANFTEDHGLGEVFAAETGFQLSRPDDPDTVLAPDVAFVPASRLPSPDSPDWNRFPRLAPDLVIEVASPTQGRNEMAAKAAMWLDGGVRLLWLVWPAAEEVEVYETGHSGPVQILKGSHQLGGGEVLPGFTYALDDLWK